MRYTLFILSALLAFAIPNQSQAQGAKDPRVEIRPFAGYRFGGNFSDSGYRSVTPGEELLEDLNVKPGSQFGLMLNVPLALLGAYDPDNNWQLEVTFALQPSTMRIDAQDDIDIPALNPNFKQDGDQIELFDLDVTYIHLGAMRQWTNGSWIPYLNFGLGGTIFKPDGDLDSKNKFSLSFGGGLKKFFNDRFGIRSQLRAWVTFLGSNDELYCDRFGCWIYEDSVNFTQFEISTGLIIRL